jgi:uncharacterized MnhB-related membrane protein
MDYLPNLTVQINLMKQAILCLHLVFTACFIEAKDPLGPLILHDVAGSLASYLFLGQLCSSTIELV